ncbi:MAG: hypothetical protein WBV23_03090, partial [Desulfobaccales bacterium]
RYPYPNLATPNRSFLAPRMAVSPVLINFFSWAGEGFWAGRGIDDLAQHSNRPRLFTEKLSIMNLEVTQEFLAGSTCSYRKNIKTFLFGME